MGTFFCKTWEINEMNKRIEAVIKIGIKILKIVFFIILSFNYSSKETGLNSDK